MARSLHQPRANGNGNGNGSISTVMIIVLNSIVLLTLQQIFFSLSPPTMPTQSTNVVDFPMIPSSTTSSSSSSPFGWVIPQGRATPLPSIRTTHEEEAKVQRKIYGGKGDKPHLGGFTSFDPGGVGPHLWKHMIQHLGIKSLLDLGCGRGISTSWFVLHGLDYVVCAEGSHDAHEESLLRRIDNGSLQKNGTMVELVEHDFSRGPWWPDRTVDAAWCVEFTEHVGRNFQQNYHTAFRKAALIFASHSNWGGWHHVEVHDDGWWQAKMESSGFFYSDYLTKEVRRIAIEEPPREAWLEEMKKRNQTNFENLSIHRISQHIWGSMQVFINPLVASLPEHQHLFAEHGCYLDSSKGHECKKEDKFTPLPESFKPLVLTKEMDDKWMDLVKDLPIS